jgi:hypothetical protein
MSTTEELRRMITGLRVSAALGVAADLGLSEQLARGPRTADDLARSVGADPDTLHRLLRALASVGVYEELPDATYANTALGEGLLPDVEGTLRPLARVLTDPAVWAAWGHLGHSVRTGENAFLAFHGQDAWTHREAHPEHNAIFNENMAALSRVVADAVAAAYDFSDMHTVVDVGGGYGALLEAVLARHQHLAGAVFDRPHVVAAAPSARASESVRARWSSIGGSFFDEVPAGDALMLKSILHDWPDDRCVEILRTCRRSLNRDGVVLVVERLLDVPGDQAETAFSDLNMLVLPGGRERTEAEYAALLEEAGLQLNAAIPTAARFWVLEARSPSSG